MSGSGDYTVKVWDISKNTFTHLNTFQGHTHWVYQVIPITNNVIASGSDDYTIRIWDVNTYKEVQTLREDFQVWTLLKLKNKDEMVAGGRGKNSVSFWNIKTFKKEHI